MRNASGRVINFIQGRCKNANGLIKEQNNIMRQMERRLNDALGDLEDCGLAVLTWMNSGTALNYGGVDE